jgi:preprotein translocase subunit SecF
MLRVGQQQHQVLGDKQQALTIRTKNLNVEERTQLQNALSEKIGAFDPKTLQIDTVGPTLGRQLFISGCWRLFSLLQVSSST